MLQKEQTKLHKYQIETKNKQYLKTVLKNFSDYVSEINNTQINNGIDLDVVMPMYNLIEYIDNYTKATGSLWQYHKDESANNITA